RAGEWKGNDSIRHFPRGLDFTVWNGLAFDHAVTSLENEIVVVHIADHVERRSGLAAWKNTGDLCGPGGAVTPPKTFAVAAERVEGPGLDLTAQWVKADQLCDRHLPVTRFGLVLHGKKSLVQSRVHG